MHNLKINGCSICGYNKCDKALHFHHIISRYKRFTITMTDIINSKRTNKQIIIELRKCILLCSNCHWEMEK